jgi:hypothetical protein
VQAVDRDSTVLVWIVRVRDVVLWWPTAAGTW